MGFFVFLVILIAVAFLVYLTWTPRGGHPPTDGRGGWWHRWRPQRPKNPPPPKGGGWKVPDYIPEWVEYEVGPVIIPPRPSPGGSARLPIRVSGR